jgi:plasmid maintenance system antidote protein VapI
VSEGRQSKRNGAGCRQCQQHPGGICPACASRQRRRALALRERDGLAEEQIAVRLGVTVARAKRLIEEAEQLRDLEQYKRDSIPVAPIRDLFERRLQEDPSLNQAHVAARMETNRIELLRAVGLQPTASRVVRGKRRPGKLRTKITVEMASRIVKALGVAPHEVPWL